MNRFSLYFICIITFFFGSANAQPFDNVLKSEQLKGTIGNSKITVQIFLRNNIVEGYYYYDRIGEPLTIFGKQNGLNLDFDVVEKSPGHTSKLDENFKVKMTLDSLNNIKEIKGGWKKKSKTLTIYASRIKTSIEWRNFSYTIYYYNSELVFDNKKQIESMDIIYPSLSSATKLNESILSDLLDGRNERFIDFVNKQKSSILSVNSSYSDSSFFDVCDCCDCLKSIANIKLSFINDSIVSFTTYAFWYVIGVHGWEAEFYRNYEISSGKLLSLDTIISKENQAVVLELIKKKYELEPSEENHENFSISGFQILAGGISFNDHACNLCSYYKYFMTYKELEPFINERFKYLIKK